MTFEISKLASFVGQLFMDKHLLDRHVEWLQVVHPDHLSKHSLSDDEIEVVVDNGLGSLSSLDLVNLAFDEFSLVAISQMLDGRERLSEYWESELDLFCMRQQMESDLVSVVGSPVGSDYADEVPILQGNIVPISPHDIRNRFIRRLDMEAQGVERLRLLSEKDPGMVVQIERDIDDAVEQMASALKSGSKEQFSAGDLKLHALISAEQSESQEVHEAILKYADMGSKEKMAATLAEHRLIVDAFKERNFDLMLKAAIRHMSLSSKRWLADPYRLIFQENLKLFFKLASSREGFLFVCTTGPVPFEFSLQASNALARCLAEAIWKKGIRLVYLVEKSSYTCISSDFENFKLAIESSLFELAERSSLDKEELSNLVNKQVVFFECDSEARDLFLFTNQDRTSGYFSYGENRSALTHRADGADEAAKKIQYSYSEKNVNQFRELAFEATSTLIDRLGKDDPRRDAIKCCNDYFRTQLQPNEAEGFVTTS